MAWGALPDSNLLLRTVTFLSQLKRRPLVSTIDVLVHKTPIRPDDISNLTLSTVT